MSQVFFDELAIPAPRHNLGIGSASHGEQTGRMLHAIETVLLEEKPDWTVVYGDTNSTLAGALAARKLNLRVAHVEAGLRSFNMRMPEEVNRILTDRISDVLFCPTETAVENLAREGVSRGVAHVGDVMYDASLFSRDRARASSRILDTLRLTPRSYVLATVHRAENTDDATRLAAVCDGLAQVAERWPVILALHPRTRRFLADQHMEFRLGRVTVIDPVPYFDMIRLEESARAICTDSGGVQKEAFFYGVPCVTLRDETEWVETVRAGWNQLVGADARRILEAVATEAPRQAAPAGTFYGAGDAATRIVRLLARDPQSATAR
jgi:UDP-GlcNAc3NAcA epimerase